jgi:hypothetical protein
MEREKEECTADRIRSEQPEAQQENIFDLDRLRLSQDFAATGGVKKALLTVPVRKPNRQDFIRVRPDEPGQEWHLETAVLEVKDERETYLIDPVLWPELPGEIVPKVLYLTINRQSVVTLWPINLPGQDGRLDEWSRSALEAAEIGKKRWIRVVANMSLGAYEVYEATGSLPEPEWPDTTFKKTIEIAFRDRFIRDLDHPVIRRLKGEW